jgi:hypothetical protein
MSCFLVPPAGSSFIVARRFAGHSGARLVVPPFIRLASRVGFRVSCHSVECLSFLTFTPPPSGSIRASVAALLLPLLLRRLRRVSWPA